MGGKGDLVDLTTSIVAAYLGNNTVAVSDLPDIIRDVHVALLEISGEAVETAKRPKPAVPIDESITPDHLICLEDGKPFKSLKRHLTSCYSMTPEDYRVRWGLPADYPMVAPNYAAERSKLAKKLGLGRKAAAAKQKRS